MSLPQLAKLVTVDPRTVWAHEATSFTPWLLANAATLGEALGMDLELTEAEHAVGGFSLDLIGRDAANDTVVIVENQLAATDHSHLGQLLTYAGGTDAATIVWVATSFRDEHRAALDWLNSRTEDDTRFFGVVVSAVTLTGAPANLVAPRFEVVAKPNDWGKKVRTVTHGGGPISQKDQLYGQFWVDWLAEIEDRSWTHQNAPAKSWAYLPTGMSGTRFVVSFRGDGLLSELYLGDAQPEANSARLALLESRRNELEAAYGRSLFFDPLEGKKGCRVGELLPGANIADVGRWTEYRAFLTDAQTRLRTALLAIGGVSVLSADVPPLEVDAFVAGDPSLSV